MANFMDYLEWRGDLTFAQSPFNDIDAMILSSLSYVNFDGIVPGIGGTYKTVKEASDEFFTLYTKEQLKKDKSFTRNMPYLMQKAAETKRFGNARLQNYETHLSETEESQFAAIEIITDDDVAFISFRGTDDTIVGWKEDFNMSYKPIPSQKYAIDYINKVMFQPHCLRIGGHSKGGHLAVYGATFTEKRNQRWIETIYALDSPGFTPAFITDERYQAIKDRVVRMIPEESIIGLLLDHDIEPVVIKCSGKGVMAHDTWTWQVMTTSPVEAKAITSAAGVFDEVFKKWVAQVEPDQRKVFVDDVFSLFEVTGLKTLTDLQNEGIHHVREIFERFNRLDKGTREVVELLFKVLWSQWWESLSSLFKVK
ncbi:MAG: DUF2974 domain-containing protein [Erysipelotrichaceae bacterium]|nr:DUF2974 domain-containing protein [Erysipelotrichaceae bacterium]